MFPSVSLTSIDSKVVYHTFVDYPDDVEHRPSPQWLCLGVVTKTSCRGTQATRKCWRTSNRYWTRAVLSWQYGVPEREW
jgi:hypothetical protein